MKDNQLFELIVKIINEEGKLINNTEELLIEVFENNGFESIESVPNWLVVLFQKVLNQESTPATKFEYKKPGTGDVYNFIAELEDVMDEKWNDTGEDVEMHFSRLKVIANVSLESNTYYVKYYGENIS